MTDEAKTFEGWAILELMGHRRLAGYVTEVQIAGAGMIRIDVPVYPWIEGCTCGSGSPESLDPEHHKQHCHMFRAPGSDAPLDLDATQFYTPAAVYCLTPATEESCRAIRSRPTPAHAWEFPQRQLEASRDPLGDILDERVDVDAADYEPDDDDDELGF